MTNFPASLDLFQNPGAATTMDAAGFEHDVQHANLNDAVAALQAKVGITGSANAAALDALVNKILGAIFNTGGSQKTRFKDGQFQIWDDGYAASDITHPWAAFTANNGALELSGPIAN